MWLGWLAICEWQNDKYFDGGAEVLAEIRRNSGVWTKASTAQRLRQPDLARMPQW